jgi:hypothetical protein
MGPKLLSDIFTLFKTEHRDLAAGFPLLVVTGTKLTELLGHINSQTIIPL